MALFWRIYYKADLMHPDFQLFFQSLTQAGYSISGKKSNDATLAFYCYYRNNPDGSIRWVWSKNNRHADFLKFYHIAGTRPYIFALFVKVSSWIGLGRLIAHGTFPCYTTSKIKESANYLNNQRWAWFAGTTGPDRKTILWKRLSASANGVFIKIAHSERAAENLTREAVQIKKFQSVNWQKVVLPEAIYHSNCCRLEDISKNTVRINRFLQLPQTGISEWLTKGVRFIHTEKAVFIRETAERIAGFCSITDDRIRPSLVNNVRQLQTRISHLDLIPVTAAHGDFTPWNVLVRNDQLLLIDWELSKDQLPLLFDLFHFIYQSNILIGNRGYKYIRKELDEVMSRPEWTNICGIEKEKWYQLEQLYLVYVISYYLQTYNLQPKWHMQVNWLLNTWEEATGWLLARESTLSSRIAMLHYLKGTLNSFNYVLLKWKYNDLISLPAEADLDICITQQDARRLSNILTSHALVKDHREQHKSYMHQLTLVLNDGELLHIDLIYDFKRKEQRFLQAGEVLASARMNDEGLKVPAPQYDFIYTWLFYWLNGADIPASYRDFFNHMGVMQKDCLTRIAQSDFGLPVKSYTEILRYNEVWATQVRMVIKNKYPISLLSRINYLLDTVRSYAGDTGMVVTFSGVDGAGKSTVISKIKTLAEKKLRKKVIVLRHRPSIFPILSAIKYGRIDASQRAAATLPRQGTNFSYLSSLLRFSWYLTDYLIGQWYIYLRYVKTGNIVLYDRYYFDLINDGRRSNIMLSPRFVKWFYHLLLKPRLNFYLYADAASILARKQELDTPTIHLLNKQYIALFGQFSSKSHKHQYLTIENIRLHDTLNQVFSHIKNASYEKID